MRLSTVVLLAAAAVTFAPRSAAAFPCPKPSFDSLPVACTFTRDPGPQAMINPIPQAPIVAPAPPPPPPAKPVIARAPSIGSAGGPGGASAAQRDECSMFGFAC